jgi:hypothetical protein
MSIETLKGLYLLETLTEPVPATITQYLKDNFATGTGPYGSFTVMDFLGTAAGVNVTNLMLQVPTLIGAMDVSVLQGIYNDMLATVSGTYGPNTGPVTIPSGPAAGVYATGDLAFTTGLIPAAQAEIANLIAAYPNQANDLNSAFNTISEQIFREAVNQAKTGLNYDELISDSQSSAMSFASGLTRYGQDNTPKNASEFLNTVAQFGTLPGQAIIGALREGRNYQSLNQAGILSTNFAVPNTYPGESSGGSANVLTPLPPVQPPIIPAPPAAQIPTNATSTDYTVDEARARIASNSEVGNSALNSAPPPVVPGPETTPPPYIPPPQRLAFNPPRPPPEGPNVRLYRSSSSVQSGEIMVVDAQVFFEAMNSYPVGTEVPYSVTGVYVTDTITPVDPSLINVSSTEGYAGRTVAYGLTPLPVGLPLNGTFRIIATRSGGFAVSTSSSLPQDAILSITVAGTTTFVGVLSQNVVVPQTSVEIIGVYPEVRVAGILQPGPPTTSIEVTKNFYVRARAIPSSALIPGSIAITQGPGSATLQPTTQEAVNPASVPTKRMPIVYSDYSSSAQGELWRVPGSFVPTVGSIELKMIVDLPNGSYAGSTRLEVIPLRYPKSISVTKDGWTLNSTPTTTDEVTTGKSFTIIVKGDPNTTFDWTGFGDSGTTATDSNGVCVFPALIAPPLSQWASNVLFRAFAGNVRDDYPLTVTWPDGEVTRSTVYVSAS